MRLKRLSSGIQVKRLGAFQLSGTGAENGTNTLRDNLTRVPSQEYFFTTYPLKSFNGNSLRRLQDDLTQ